MKPLTLDAKRYRDQVLGCWLGKNIGGTLGAPFEGRKRTRSLSFYEPVPSEPLPNDDLDLQLVWLRMMEDLDGRKPHLSDFARYWMRYLHQFPPDEYGFCLRNLDRGLRPPISGVFENRDIDCMGAPIRSEIWACLAPADPQRAAVLAMQDAMLDHAGGEGVWGEMFWAAVQSAAFVVDDPLTLIDIGLEMIPLSSNLGRAIREVVWCYKNNQTWGDARESIAIHFSNPSFGKPYGAIPGAAHPMLAAPNHGFTIIGWLYGQDFGDKLCKAVNCGYDTDCTGATLGALLGIMHGASAIPEKWSQPVGRGIVRHKFTSPCGEPKHIDELTDRVIRLADQWRERGHTCTKLGQGESLDDDLHSRLLQNEQAIAAWQAHDIHSAQQPVDDCLITLHYHGRPVLFENVTKRIAISITRDGQRIEAQRVTLQTPSSWRVTPAQSHGHGFDLHASQVEPRNLIRVMAEVDGREMAAVFMMLGPAEAVGVGMAYFVPQAYHRGPRLRENPLPEDLDEAYALQCQCEGQAFPAGQETRA